MYGDIVMPFAGFDDFDDCLETMQTEEGHDEESARNICGALQAEEKSDSGDVDELREALERGAGLIADVGVDLVSGVDVPAVDSKWVALKADSDDHDWRADVPILLRKQDEPDGDDGDDEGDRRISYAAAMIPREPDKEGDVAPTPTVERAAHDFLKSDGGIDTDHSLIDGEGEPVESWVLKQDREFVLPDGESETYAAGTWMLGIEWGAEAWERITSGELTGLSIYGMAEHVPLERAATCAACGATLSAGDGSAAATDDADDGQTGDSPKGESEKSDGMGTDTDTPDTDPEESTGDDAEASGPDIEAVAASVDDLAETVAEMKDLVETEKQDAREAASVLAEEMDFDDADEVMDLLAAANNEDDDEEDEDDEMESAADEGETAETETAEKRAADAHLGKGADPAGTAQSGVTGETSTDLSYAELAAQED